MEPTTPIAPPAVAPKKNTPWGALIGLLLILVIIVAGAYYALTERIASKPPAAAATVQY